MSLSLLLKTKGERRESAKGGETRREDIHVGETEGERHTEQMTWCTFGRALWRLQALLGDFRCAAATDVKVLPSLLSLYLLNEPHVWQAKICSPSQDTLASALWLVCAYFTHSVSTLTVAHIRALIRLMTDECDNCWVFGGIPRKICHLIGIIQRRGWGAGAPVGAMIALCD